MRLHGAVENSKSIMSIALKDLVPHTPTKSEQELLFHGVRIRDERERERERFLSGGIKRLFIIIKK